jgi:hypothetical protein
MQINNEEITEVFDFYNNNDIGIENKTKYRNLFVQLGALGSFCEQKFIPTGRIRFTITASKYQTQNEAQFFQTLNFITYIDIKNASVYNVSKIIISKLEEQNLDSNEFKIIASADEEFNVFGYAGDINRKYPNMEYRNINTNFTLFCKSKIDSLIQNYKKFKSFEENFFNKK